LSIAPPGAKGTMILIGLIGNACACATEAGSAAEHEAAAASSNAANLRFMVSSSGGFTVAESGNNPRK